MTDTDVNRIDITNHAKNRLEADTNPRCIPGCDHGEHTNPHCRCNTPDDQRAVMLRNYHDAIKSIAPEPLLLPLNREGKLPIIEGRCGLDDPWTKNQLHTPEEAVNALRNGARGFALYAGRSAHGTGDLVFTDHDYVDVWPPGDTPRSLLSMSGSGRGYHKTYFNAGDVKGADGKGKKEGAGEVRANNRYVVAPGSIHPSGGIYHVVEDPGIAELASDDLSREFRPCSLPEPANVERIDPGEIRGLPNGFDPGAVTNEFDAPLRDIRTVSPKLNELLTYIDHSDYRSPSETDMATVRLLLHWRFEDVDVTNILRACRARRKMHRDDYVSRTITQTTTDIVRPVDLRLGKAVVADALDNDGRPSVGMNHLDKIQGALDLLGGEATTNELIGVIPNRDAKPDSVRRRIDRAMDIFEEAGYVTWTRSGRTIVWQSKGIEDLDFFYDF